jgi:Thoeris protein ThsB, TIR-like domain
MLHGLIERGIEKKVLDRLESHQTAEGDLAYMPRTVYFCFHYQRDIMRVQQVKQHYVTKGNYTEAGFFDGSLEEKAKREGDEAVKRLIDKGLSGSSVLCVLIGKETYTRRWVDYEILKSVELGMGVFGIRIHQLKHPKEGADTAGSNPLDYLGYGTKDGKLRPMIKYSDGWKDAPHLSLISPSAAAYLEGTDKPVLSSLFRIYDWIDNDGYNNFGIWAEAAAKQARR